MWCFLKGTWTPKLKFYSSFKLKKYCKLKQLTDLAKIAAIVLFIIDELVSQDEFDFGSKTFFLAFYLACGSTVSSMISASIGNYAIRLKKREY